MENIPTIKKRYQTSSSIKLSFSSKNEHTRSRTKQAFAEEANINTIMQRYDKTGLLVDPSNINTGRIAEYGDFSSGTEFLDIQNRILEAQNNFALLPSNLRSMFDNKASNLLDYISNPDNLEEAIDLGLVEAPEKPQTTPEELAAADAAAAAAKAAEEAITPPESSETE